jgi:hypothetical protein
VSAACPEPGQDQVLGRVTSLRHPQNAIALEREASSCRRIDRRDRPSRCRRVTKPTAERRAVSPFLRSQNAGGTDPGFKHNTPLRASGGPTECQFPDMKSVAAAKTAAMLCKHAAEAGTLNLKPAHQDSTGGHKQSLGATLKWAAPIVSSPTPSCRAIGRHAGARGKPPLTTHVLVGWSRATERMTTHRASTGDQR